MITKFKISFLGDSDANHSSMNRSRPDILIFLFFIGNRKLKSTFLKRNFGENVVKNENKCAEENLNNAQSTTQLKWKFGAQHAYYVYNEQTYRPLNGNTTNLTPVHLTNYVYQRGLHVSAEDVCSSYDHLDQKWSVGNRSRLLYSSGIQPSSLHPASAMSSGYSSVNQSCASSAGTGSQRSRSPTPDQFETLREESPLPEPGRFGYQLGEKLTSRGSGLERVEELVVCGGGDRHPSNSPVRGGC